jgi:hypothetical protein
MDTDMPVEASETTEIPSETPEPLPPLQPLAGKRPRSEAQLRALEAARAKALQVRKERAQIRNMERAVQNAQKVQRMAYRSTTEEPDWDTPIEEWPDLPMPVKQEPKRVKKRKPARRIVVTEVSSESEEEDVEVILPKHRTPPPPTREELHMQRAMDKMFSYGI